jgi:hypothetical protein
MALTGMLVIVRIAESALASLTRDPAARIEDVQ